MDYLEVIYELNQELYDKHGDLENQFFYTANGYIDVIGFGDFILWHSEDDTREWIEEKNDYEPFKPFIKKLFNDYIDDLYSLKF